MTPLPQALPDSVDGGRPGEYAEPCPVCAQRIYVTTVAYSGVAIEVCRCGGRPVPINRNPPPPDGVMSTEQTRKLARTVANMPDIRYQTKVCRCGCGSPVRGPAWSRYASHDCRRKTRNRRERERTAKRRRESIGERLRRYYQGTTRDGAWVRA